MKLERAEERSELQPLKLQLFNWRWLGSSIPTYNCNSSSTFKAQLAYIVQLVIDSVFGFLFSFFLFPSSKLA
jgi:hypothetical protein